MAGRNHIQSNAVASAARTASGNSGDLITFSGVAARFLIAVTAVSGTSPTLTITIEGKTKGGNYVTLATSTQITAVASQSIDVLRLPQTYRISWAIGGTSPSFTFETDVIQKTQ